LPGGRGTLEEAATFSGEISFPLGRGRGWSKLSSSKVTSTRTGWLRKEKLVEVDGLCAGGKSGAIGFGLLLGRVFPGRGLKRKGKKVDWSTKGGNMREKGRRLEKGVTKKKFQGHLISCKKKW